MNGVNKSATTYGCNPLGQLLLKVVAVQEPALLEEAAIDPLDDVLDGAFLTRAVRPADLGGEADLHGGAGEDGIPFGDAAVLLPRQRDGLGPVKDAAQRHVRGWSRGDYLVGV